MTSENIKQPYESNLESIASAIVAKVDHVDTAVRHIYNAVNDLAGKTDDIIDAIEYHRDSPAYNGEMGFLDGLDE